MTDTQLLLLPGLGADARLFAPQRRAFPDLLTPAWPPLRGRESLAEYSVRCAEEWCLGSRRVIDTGRPFYLGGVSFGGQVAIEMGRHLDGLGTPPAGVFVLSGCRSREAVTELFRLQQSLGSVVPNALAAVTIAGPIATMFVSLDGLDGEAAEVVRAMAKDVDVPLLKRFADAAAKWDLNAAEARSLPFPVHQIHGEKDRIIPMRKGDPDRVLAGGGHLINLTRADDVNAFLAEKMAAVETVG
ncbi:MAG: alpha/beta hydrolase [Planctomycetota bacterium]